ncbi:hypothetical protein L9F63_022433, partial [Diploptera punctata]
MGTITMLLLLAATYSISSALRLPQQDDSSQIIASNVKNEDLVAQIPDPLTIHSVIRIVRSPQEGKSGGRGGKGKDADEDSRPRKLKLYDTLVQFDDLASRLKRSPQEERGGGRESGGGRGDLASRVERSPQEERGGGREGGGGKGGKGKGRNGDSRPRYLELGLIRYDTLAAFEDVASRVERSPESDNAQGSEERKSLQVKYYKNTDRINEYNSGNVSLEEPEIIVSDHLRAGSFDFKKPNREKRSSKVEENDLHEGQTKMHKKNVDKNKCCGELNLLTLKTDHLINYPKCDNDSVENVDKKEDQAGKAELPTSHCEFNATGL